MGQYFKDSFDNAGVTGVTKIVTAEVSGIAPALTTAIAYDVPVVFARKKKPITMADGVYESHAPSHTKGGITPLIISPEYLLSTDKVILIDDFLASGRTIKALVVWKVIQYKYMIDMYLLSLAASIRINFGKYSGVQPLVTGSPLQSPSFSPNSVHSVRCFVSWTPI